MVRAASVRTGSILGSVGLLKPGKLHPAKIMKIKTRRTLKRFFKSGIS
jgi:hypothetical protein